MSELLGNDTNCLVTLGIDQEHFINPSVVSVNINAMFMEFLSKCSQEWDTQPDRQADGWIEKRNQMHNMLR